jgi:hypothetical protein
MTIQRRRHRGEWTLTMPWVTRAVGTMVGASWLARAGSSADRRRTPHGTWRCLGRWRGSAEPRTRREPARATPSQGSEVSPHAAALPIRTSRVCVPEQRRCGKSTSPTTVTVAKCDKVPLLYPSHHRSIRSTRGVAMSGAAAVRFALLRPRSPQKGLFRGSRSFTEAGSCSPSFRAAGANSGLVPGPSAAIACRTGAPGGERRAGGLCAFMTPRDEL